MSIYHDFLNGIPNRTLSLLEYYNKEKEKIKDHKNNVEQTIEVTLLISLAMPVFVITTEEIRFNVLNENYKTKLESEPISSSIIFNNLTNSKIGVIEENKLFSNIGFNQVKNNLNDSKKKVLSTLKLIRNALSHGSIRFQTKSNSEEIQAIYFGSKRTSVVYKLPSKNELEEINANKSIDNLCKLKLLDENNETLPYSKFLKNETINGWDLLLMDVSDFKQLLENWCNFLKSQKNPMGIVRFLNTHTNEDIMTGTND